MAKGFLSFICTFILLAFGGVQGFLAPSAPSTQNRWTSSYLKDAPTPVELASPSQSSSLEVSVDTLDPTTFLSDILSGLFGTSAILAVPIVAALSVAGLVVFFIVSYANPAEPDE